MSRDHPRRRRSVSAERARLLPLIGFRYSAGRDAYVFRIVGNRFGPVFQIPTRFRPVTALATHQSPPAEAPPATNRPITGTARNRPITGRSPEKSESLTVSEGDSNS
jgi:hypothetical protein